MRTKKQSIAPDNGAIPTLTAEEVIDNPIKSLAIQETAIADKRSYVRNMPTDEEMEDTDVQKRLMRDISGMIVKHFYTAVKNKELDFNQEIKLFKEIAPFIGYTNDGNKIAQDIGMDALSMKYLEISAHVKKSGQKSSSKV